MYRDPETLKSDIWSRRGDPGTCPLDSKLYGGCPSWGGYASYTEYEIGAGRIAEATHCILGSLGKIVTVTKRPDTDLDSIGGKGLERGHISEEWHIIQDALEEYSRQLYVEQLLRYRDVKPQFRSQIRESNETSIEHMKAVSPILRRLAEELKQDLNHCTDIPPVLVEVADACYDLLIALTVAVEASVQDWPSFGMENAYRDPALRRAASRLRRRILDLYPDADLDPVT